MKKIFLYLLLVGAGSMCFSGSTTTDENNTTPTKPFSFVFEDLNGNEVNLDELHDKTVFLNFWSTRCAPCIHEMPSIAVAQKKLKDTNFVFYTVSDDMPMNILKFQRKNKQKFPFKYLYSPVNKNSFDVQYLPHTYVLKNGMIMATYKGVYDWSSEAKISELRSMTY